MKLDTAKETQRGFKKAPRQIALQALEENCKITYFPQRWSSKYYAAMH